ncbi:MAG: hypothetical protein EXR98_10110 [Gemmataceae bacterium]|nr:hypothetical protein [Gemmataceae bacterium]
MLRQLLDVECGGLSEESNSGRRQFDAEVLQPVAGASQNAVFQFFRKPGKSRAAMRISETGFLVLERSLPNFWVKTVPIPLVSLAGMM